MNFCEFFAYDISYFSTPVAHFTSSITVFRYLAIKSTREFLFKFEYGNIAGRYSKRTGKKVLLAFLDSLNYRYSTYSDDNTLSDKGVQEMLQRKAYFLAGKTTSRSCNEIKKRYESV
ncbi:hypothetical protein [Mucilaginibacter celer]|uniref:Uncharacterized protein n=1 Tax=Mucilaginibacter celer TaxID=2305508 RepID=A0A494VTH3_9SPHI|nr:hypothetical protein [Mucilaginibacter celer]AYL94643.1 hypothetical protein HYN43_004735 [Mucilaginibacter celer]